MQNNESLKLNLTITSKKSLEDKDTNNREKGEHHKEN